MLNKSQARFTKCDLILNQSLTFFNICVYHKSLELLIRKEHISRDSQQYILRRLETDPKLKSFVTKDSAELLNQLHIKASGCFIYLEIILNLINNQTISLRQIKEIPGTLSGTFSNINVKNLEHSQPRWEFTGQIRSSNEWVAFEFQSKRQFFVLVFDIFLVIAAFQTDPRAIQSPTSRLGVLFEIQP